MERERLTRLVQEPGRMAREDLAGLKALTEKYPWFSGAQLLRTAGERRSADVLFDETLRTASAHLPSRAVLFDLTAAPPPAILHVVKPEPVKAAGPIEPPVTREEVEEPPPALLADVPGTEAHPPPMPARAGQVEAPEEAAPLGKDVPIEELDRQIVQAAMAGAYDLALLEQLPLAEAVRTPPPSIPVTGESVPQPHPVAPGSRMRFTEWLDLLEAPASSPASENIPGRPAVPASPSEKAAPSTPDTPPLSTAELIDRFIRQETPEPKAKAAFFTPQQAGKRSLDDTAGLVTETLARIYEKQGNLPKAIDTYRRLVLKYPEKAAYFAALQKNLEGQQIK